MSQVENYFGRDSGFWFGRECFEHGMRHIAADDVFPTGRADEAFDHRGRELCDITRGHEKNGVDLGSHVRVDVAHDAFVFVVVRGANAAQDEIGVHAFGVVDQIAVIKVGDGESFAGCGGGAEELNALLDGETVGFLRIVADGDDETVEEFEAALDHPEVAIGGRIERACVNCGAHEEMIRWIGGRSIKKRFGKDAVKSIDLCVTGIFND